MFRVWVRVSAILYTDRQGRELGFVFRVKVRVWG